jgi:zinc protease
MKYLLSLVLITAWSLVVSVSFCQTVTPSTESKDPVLISESLKGSKIIKTEKVKQFGAVEWTLSNNAKVVFKKVSYEKDIIILNALSLGGTSLYDIDMLPSATMLSSIIGTYGLGDFDNATLQKLLSGKKATVAINLSELTEGVSGSSTPEDFETMMQLLYLRFEKPRFDKIANDDILDRYNTFFANMATDPTKIMQDSVSLFLTNYSPRTMIMNQEFLKLVDMEKIRKIYNERFRNVSDFTFFIVGNIDEGTVKQMVQKYIGSIRGYSARENWTDGKVIPPKGKFLKVVEIPLPVPKATVFISHTSLFNYNSYNNVTMKVIQGILDIVFTEKIKESAGGSYGVSVNFSSQKFPRQAAADLIMLDCDTAEVNELKTIIYREIDNLVKMGPGKETLSKVISNLLRNREESRLHNSYWSNALYAYYFTGVDVNDSNNYEEILKTLTPDDVRKVAESFFSKADVADLVFLPKSH